MELRYIVPGKPATWQRKRLTARSGKVRTFTARSQSSAAARHRMLALAALGSRRATWSLDGAFAVEGRGYWSSAVVGDVDRLASLALDALEGLAYRVDRQVRSLLSEVIADGSPERVEVVVRRLAEDPVQPKKRARKKRGDRGQARARGAGCDPRRVPFGLREHHPYKVWLDEVRRQRGLPRASRRGTPARAKQDAAARTLDLFAWSRAT